MKRRSTLFLRELLFSIIAWYIIIYLYALMFMSLSEFYKNTVLYDYVWSWQIHLEIFMQAIFFGFLFTLINYYLEKSNFRRLSFGLKLLLKSFSYLIALFIVGYSTNIIFILFELVSEEFIEKAAELITTTSILFTFLYMFIGTLLINFFTQAYKKFGPNNLFRLFTGKYIVPKEEERIFLFLDLQNSTGLAEKLGHIKYSKLIRECYHDLTEIIFKYNAEVYQYVGDEVVLCWKKDLGLKKDNCIKAYFAYINKLNSEADYYSKNFDVVPFFKAGLDMGLVTVAEIGDIKREIAYHGDVLNTASRIQEQCSIYKKGMLLSEHLEKELELKNDFQKEFIGNLSLKGKTETIGIYSLEFSNN